MSEFNSIFVPGGAPKTLEFDPTCRAVYIRFKSARINKTVSEKHVKDCIVTIDLDSNNAVIGVELIGVKEFSIAAIRHKLPDRMKQMDFERARFMPTFCADRGMVPA